MGMAGEARSNLKLVAGNKHLLPMPKNGRVAPWPPLRVVGVDYVVPTESVSLSSLAPPKNAARSRPTWGMMWAVALVVALAQGIEQAIAAYW